MCGFQPKFTRHDKGKQQSESTKTNKQKTSRPDVRYSRNFGTIRSSFYIQLIKYINVVVLVAKLQLFATP